MPTRFSLQDEAFMRRALALAQRGRGRVEPNPVVGCVLVRNGRIVGEGYHHAFGGPHAEVWALRAAGPKARGATAYVTLEPCSHYGKTPPCTDALIAAGVRRVIAAMRDLSPPVSGQGFKRLRAAGIATAAGLLETESMRMNAAYLKLKFTRRPWVILKWAQSLDGKIATRTGDSKWISSEASRRIAHRLRGRIDAVLVGVSTAIVDNPDLTCRTGRPKRIATRVVLDPKLRLPLSTKLVCTAKRTPTLVVTDRRIEHSPRARRLQQAGVELLGVGVTRSGLNLAQMLDAFGRRNMSNLMVEGGGKTLGAFLDAGLADEALVFVSPRLIGGQNAISALSAQGPAKIADTKWPVTAERKQLGPDTLYRLVFTDATRFSLLTSHFSLPKAVSTSHKPRGR